MQVATWNVNSVRSRLDHATQWLQTNPVDVLCLQETKVVNDDFPLAAFEALGYTAYVHGQKSYNGVALLSRQPLEAVQCGFSPVLGEDRVGDLDDQKRVISGLWGDIYIVNLYVPNGSAIGSDKYEYKLRWLACLKEYLAALLVDYPNLNVCGDFNIALDDKDVYNPEGKEKHIMSSPTEREALIAEPGRHTEFGGKYPVAALRNLHPMIRSAATEVSRAQHSRHYRDLFRELRDIMSAELGEGDGADKSDE